MDSHSEKTINEVKQMLRRFYNGETSKDDMRKLNEFFAKANAEELPDDMRDDAEIFKLMSAETNILEADVPENLEACIRKTIGKGAKKPKILKLTSWISAAAAIAVIIFMTSPIGHKSDNFQTDLIAELPATIDSTTTITDISDVVTASEIQSDDTVKTNHDNNMNKQDIEHGNYIEINDPEEAARIATEALTLLRDKMVLANNSIAKTDKRINNINTSIKRILNNEKI